MDTKKYNLLIGICLVGVSFLSALLFKSVFMVDFDKVELAKMDGSVRVQCGSDSMGLTFGCNDLLYYTEVKKDEELVPGDIYIYRKDDDSKVVHRLIECIDIDCNLTVFKGDNNAVGEFVERKDVLQKIESVRYRWKTN